MVTTTGSGTAVLVIGPHTACLHSITFGTAVFWSATPSCKYHGSNKPIHRTTACCPMTRTLRFAVVNNESSLMLCPLASVLDTHCGLLENSVHSILKAILKANRTLPLMPAFHENCCVLPSAFSALPCPILCHASAMATNSTSATPIVTIHHHCAYHDHREQDHPSGRDHVVQIARAKVLVYKSQGHGTPCPNRQRLLRLTPARPRFWPLPPLARASGPMRLACHCPCPYPDPCPCGCFPCLPCGPCDN